MNVKVYLNWQERQILTESEFNEMVAKRTQEKLNDDYELNYFLERSYLFSEVFRLTPEEKDEIYKEFQEFCREEAETDIMDDDDWVEKIIKI